MQKGWLTTIFGGLAPKIKEIKSKIPSFSDHLPGQWKPEVPKGFYFIF